jgi:hypothetical protein
MEKLLLEKIGFREPKRGFRGVGPRNTTGRNVDENELSAKVQEEK